MSKSNYTNQIEIKPGLLFKTKGNLYLVLSVRKRLYSCAYFEINSGNYSKWEYGTWDVFATKRAIEDDYKDGTNRFIFLTK